MVVKKKIMHAGVNILGKMVLVITQAPLWSHACQ